MSFQSFIRSSTYDPELSRMILDYYHTHYYLFITHGNTFYLAPDKITISDTLLGGPFEISYNDKYLYFIKPSMSNIYFFDKNTFNIDNWYGPFDREDAQEFVIRNRLQNYNNIQVTFYPI